MEFAKRMARLETGIFSKLAEIKNARLAEGKPVVDLSVGTPNIPPSDEILNVLLEAAADRHNYVYAISDLPELREAVASWYLTRYGVTLDPVHEILSLQGSQEGLTNIALAVADEGDVVLVPDPCYPAFADGPRIAGAELYFMPQRPENNYIIDLDEIPEEIARRAKLIIVNYPNNPTTAVAPPEFYEKLIAFAKKYDIWVLHDNAYSELVFDGVHGGSFLAYEGAFDVGVEFNSMSKTYGLAGARIGFCLGNCDLVAKLAKLKSNTDYGMFIPFQKAAAAAITGDQSCVVATREAYEHRRNVLCDGLKSIGWNVERSPSTMFVWAKLPAGFEDSEEFAMEMIRRAGVMVTPGSAFGPAGRDHVRLALVQDEDVIHKAIAAIRDSGILG